MNPNDLFNLPLGKFLNEIDSISNQHQQYGIENRINKKYFSYIPYTPHLLMKKFYSKIIQFESFMDVGCGIGSIMAIAKYIGINTIHGIECDEQIAKYAEKLFGFKLGKDIIVDDAFKHKKIDTKYEQPLIYYFHPIADEKLLSKLYLHMAEMYKGAKHLEVLTPFGIKNPIHFVSRLELIDLVSNPETYTKENWEDVKQVWYVYLGKELQYYTWDSIENIQNKHPNWRLYGKDLSFRQLRFGQNAEIGA